MRGLFRFNEEFVYKMPVHFGGDPFYPVRTVYGDMTCLGVSFRTEEDALLRFIPEDFEMLEPVVNVQYANCRDVDWMAGGEYRLIQASVPVRYEGNSEGLVGEYVLVIWENKACPIIGGREEDGMPKIFADIASERHVGERWFTSASYESNTFLSLEVTRRGELDEEQIAGVNKNPKINFFGWRYLPNLGKGGATLSHATLYPQEMVVRRVWTGEGSLRWTPLPYEQHPLQCRIIGELAGLPVAQYLGAKMVKGTARLNVGDSRMLP